MNFCTDCGHNAHTDHCESVESFGSDCRCSLAWMEPTPIFSQLAAEHLARSRPLIDAIVAVGVADIIAGLEVELIWAAGDVQ